MKSIHALSLAGIIGRADKFFFHVLQKGAFGYTFILVFALGSTWRGRRSRRI